jgi:hypothetical protein
MSAQKNMSAGDLDRSLAAWPALTGEKLLLRAEDSVIEEEGEGHWAHRSEAILAAAIAAKATGSCPDALLAAPTLATEPGEPSMQLASSQRSPEAAASSSSGEKRMSNDSDDSRGSAPEARGSLETPVPSVASPSRRPSLKEMAERASKAPGARPSIAGGSTPPPARVSRPSEAGHDDSGIVDLNIIRSLATPGQRAAAEKALPASAGLFDDDDKGGDKKAPASKKGEAVAAAATAAPASAAPAAAAVAPAAAPANSNGKIWGGVLALVGIAAAFAIYQSRSHNNVAPTPQPIAAESHQDKPVVASTAAPVQTAAPVAAATTDPGATNVDSLPDKVADQPRPSQGPMPSGVAVASKDPSDVAKPALPATGSPPASSPSGKPKDLAQAMQDAVDPNDKGTKPAEKLEPASGPKGGNQNIPEQPPQGSVSAAMGGVMGGAKACVAGADDVSRAQVTFASGGNVTSVSVTGWAAANGKSGCVKSALQGAKVGAFSKPSFTVGVTIRP